MNQYYFYDDNKEQKYIIKANNKKECLVKFIELVVDEYLIDEMFEYLDNVDIEMTPLNELKVYE